MTLIHESATGGTVTVHERMAAVTRALSYIPKESSQGVNYQFRSIDALMNKLHGPLADNGLFLSPRVLDDWQINQIPGTQNRMQTQALFRICVDVWAEDGSFVTLGPGLAQSHDYGDKAVYQAQQNALKYLLLEAFCIPTSEQDMDAREADPVTPFDPAVYAREQVTRFEKWTVEQRQTEWKEAAGRLGIGKPANQEEADRVLAAMQEKYEHEGDES